MVARWSHHDVQGMEHEQGRLGEHKENTQESRRAELFFVSFHRKSMLHTI